MSTRSTIALTTLITTLVCSLAFMSVLFFGTLDKVIEQKQMQAVQEFIASVISETQKTNGQTSIKFADGVTMDIRVTLPQAAPVAPVAPVTE